MSDKFKYDSNYLYLISYAHDTGFGTIEIYAENPINSFERAREVEKTIEKKNGLSINIMNIMLLDKKND